MRSSSQLSSGSSQLSSAHALLCMSTLNAMGMATLLGVISFIIDIFLCEFSSYNLCMAGG